jgi:uncharacterized protein YbjT (DUF2867 family)
MILVTSANGNQGKHLIPKLQRAGEEFRCAVRTATSAEQLRLKGVREVVVGDLADPSFVAAAMHGVRLVYHIGPTLHPAERAIGFLMIDAARAAGVEHFVFSSVLHAILTDLVQHAMKRDIEEYLLASNLEFTILQPSNYMMPSRLVPVFAEGVFRLSWSLDRRQSMVDLDDVAEVAALILRDPAPHAAATYELVGPGRYTAHDIARTLTDVLGRPICAERIDPETFARSRLARLDPATLDPAAVEYQHAASVAIAARYSQYDFIGNANILTWLLGRAPTSFDAFVRREQAKFKGTQRSPI